MQSAANASTPHSTTTIPWAQIHYAHISNLRGQLRYLKFISEKNHHPEQLAAYIQRTRQAIHDAKAAAIAAGIIPPPPPNRPHMKRRRSVTFAPDVEILSKKSKFHPGPAGAVPRYSKRTLTRDPPAAEEVAALTSALGKRARSPEEEEEAGPEKAKKRSRFVYLEKKYWKPCQYEGDTTDDEDDDEDDADFAPMPGEGSSTSTSSSESAPIPKAKSSSSSSTSDKPLTTTPLHKSKHTTPEIAPQSSAKKHKKNNSQRLIEDSSKRHVEEEEQVVVGGGVKKLKMG